MSKEGAGPCRPTRLGSGLFTIALSSSVLWYLYWMIMAPVETDVNELVNWYFYMKFSLREMYDVYGFFMTMGWWLPLIVLIVYGFTKMIQSTLLEKLQQVIYAAATLYNLLLFVYLMIAGERLTTLFKLVLPLQLAMFIRNSWLFVMLMPTVFGLLFYLLWNCAPTHPKKRCPVPGKGLGASFSGAAISIAFAVLLHILVAVMVRWIIQAGCAPCKTEWLPPKPLLVAHRGCGHNFPENSVRAFKQSAKLHQVTGLETDVQISSDGELFLLHDPHPLRTSDILTRCPSENPFRNASWLNYSSGGCPLKELDVGSWFYKSSQHILDDLKLPTLAQFLEIAKESGRNVIFDLYEPNVEHPYHASYVNKSVEVIVQSGIDMSKVWWLANEGRQWVHSKYPAMVQVTKTKNTPFEEFEREHIEKVNDDWSTPLHTLRKYQSSNLSLNMFFVESVFMFNYAWCIAIQSVTTGSCRELSALKENNLFQVCSDLRQMQNHTLLPLMLTLALCCVSCVTCFECLRKQTWKN